MCPLRRRPPLAQEVGALSDGVLKWPIDPAFDPEVAGVPDLLQRRETRPEVEMAAARLEAVPVGDIEVNDPPPGLADAGGEVDFLDVHVEDVNHDPDFRPDLLGERHPVQTG